MRLVPYTKPEDLLPGRDKHNDEKKKKKDKEKGSQGTSANGSGEECYR